MTTITYPSGVVAPLPPMPVKRWTVAEYHQMIENGTLKSGDPVELLEGWLVNKMSRNTPHDVALVLLQESVRPFLSPGWHTRGQSAITTADSEPEPDMAIVRGAARDYLAHHPEANEIGLLVEIADASLTHDRGFKARIYARAGIIEYWIVNLIDMQIEVYTRPDALRPEPAFAQRTDYLPGDSVPLVLDSNEVARIPVADLLP
jgi:Uma2 family endonuclease